jgi:hypothetical protein
VNACQSGKANALNTHRTIRTAAFLERLADRGQVMRRWPPASEDDLSAADERLREHEPSASDIERWWQEGRVAVDSEHSIGTCPYPRFSVPWLWWVRGYRAGEATAEPERRASGTIDTRLPPGVSDPRD